MWLRLNSQLLPRSAWSIFLRFGCNRNRTLFLKVSPHIYITRVDDNSTHNLSHPTKHKEMFHQKHGRALSQPYSQSMGVGWLVDHLHLFLFFFFFLRFYSLLGILSKPSRPLRQHAYRITWSHLITLICRQFPQRVYRETKNTLLGFWKYIFFLSVQLTKSIKSLLKVLLEVECFIFAIVSIVWTNIQWSHFPSPLKITELWPPSEWPAAEKFMPVWLPSWYLGEKWNPATKRANGVRNRESAHPTRNFLLAFETLVVQTKANG